MRSWGGAGSASRRWSRRKREATAWHTRRWKAERGGKRSAVCAGSRTKWRSVCSSRAAIWRLRSFCSTFHSHASCCARGAPRPSSSSLMSDGGWRRGMGGGAASARRKGRRARVAAKRTPNGGRGRRATARFLLCTYISVAVAGSATWRGCPRYIRAQPLYVDTLCDSILLSAHSQRARADRNWRWCQLSARTSTLASHADTRAMRRCQCAPRDTARPSLRCST